MALIYAGKTDFEFGMYSVAERNALDAADDRPDNTGATLDGSIRTAGWLDKQVLNRYGLKMHQLPDDSEATLRRFLSTPGYAFLVQGSTTSLPTVLRRWEPEFNGGHAVCVIAGTQPRWLDPLAIKGYRGDLTTVDTILRFAWDGAKYSRYMKKDELASLPDTGTEDDLLTITIEKYAIPRRIVGYAPDPTKSGELWPPTIRAYKPPVHEMVKHVTLKAGDTSPFHASGHAEVLGWDKDPTKVYRYWVAADGYFGPDSNGGTALFVADTNLTRPDPMPTTADVVAAAKNQAIAATNAQWESWVAQRPKGS